MFLYIKKSPILYGNVYFTLADTLSGSVFLISAFYAYSMNVLPIALLACALSFTSMLHIQFPFYALRVIDYSLAITYMITCAYCIVYSNFLFPHTLIASVCALCALLFYSLYHHKRDVWTPYYFFWHVFALIVALFSITAYVDTLV